MTLSLVKWKIKNLPIRDIRKNFSPVKDETNCSLSPGTELDLKISIF